MGYKCFQQRSIVFLFSTISLLSLVSFLADFSPSWSWGIAIIAGLLDILIAVAVVFLERRFD